MAKRRKSRRKSYRGYVSVPSLGFLKTLKGSVDGMDVLVGGVAGMAAAGLVKYAYNEFVPLDLKAKIPAVAAKALPVVFSALGGAALYYGQKKSSRGKGHMIGAIAGGLAIVTWDTLREQFPQLADYGSYVYPSLGGVIADNPRLPFNGVIMDNPNLGALSAMAMADADEDDVA